MAINFPDQLSLTSPPNTGIQPSPIRDESGKPASSSTDAEMLLRALRNVIIPLARPADGEYKRDVIRETALGPDEKEFVIALEKFIMSFLGSQRGSVGGIEVDLEEKATNVPNPESQKTSDDNLCVEDVAAASSDTKLRVEKSTPKRKTNDDGLWSILPFHNEESPEIFLRGSTSISHTGNSHSHYNPAATVFNHMLRQTRATKVTIYRKDSEYTTRTRLQHDAYSPITLQPDASKLQITLIERGEIYAHIASNFVNSFNTPEVSRNMIRYKIDYGPGSEEEEELINIYCQYAILSHTWLHGESREVTYDDWIRGEFDVQQPGYQKLVNFCRMAWNDYEVAFGWMDTVCINKESSAELDESIRSMYKWYEGAYPCITYLAETVKLSDMHHDTWFTRGWTLQELIAPSHIKFYNADWKKLVESNENDKADSVIQKEINTATTITENELRQPMSSIFISRRMEMAAKRQVTREEDAVYSLMGILDVSISTAYGEGVERVFSRLLREVLNSSSEYLPDLFNWAGVDRSRTSKLLPLTLQGYLHRSSSLDLWTKPVEPIILTHLGLRITMLLMPAILIENLTESQCDPYENYHAITDIAIDSRFKGDVVSGSYSILDARLSDRYGWNKDKTFFQLIFGILNVGDGANNDIIIPKSCLAVALLTDIGYHFPLNLPTEAPITFTLNKKRSSDEDILGSYLINRNELESHGMKLVTMIL